MSEIFAIFDIQKMGKWFMFVNSKLSKHDKMKE